LIADIWTNLEVFVAGFLPFLVQGVWFGVSEESDGTEENASKTKKSEYTKQNRLAFAWGVTGSGSVGSKGNIVSYKPLRQYIGGWISGTSQVNEL
jgi:hypothetical protein